MDVILGGFAFACLIATQFLAVMSMRSPDIRDSHRCDLPSAEQNSGDMWSWPVVDLVSRSLIMTAAHSSSPRLVGNREEEST